MELQDRIHNIKTLLEYCPKSTEDVHIVDEKVGLFFAKFFNSHGDRFKHTPYEHVYPRISLCETLNKDYKTHSTTVCVEYVYDNDRDGYYTKTYYFNDEDLEDSCSPFHKSWLIEYSEIPDNIWAIIQDTLYEKATEYINKKLKSAKQSVIYWEDKLIEFNTKIKIKL